MDWLPNPWNEHGGSSPQGARVRFECSSRYDNPDLADELADELVKEANKGWKEFRPRVVRRANSVTRFEGERIGFDVIAEGIAA